ncbi:ABC transporter ATP-binding protein [Microvirga subterranea]|uniref:Amino acid/amide ABC transporter ATP-binding protein 1 (HAAT family) n=1 Tax=Microvirga subterranea TaxID=186651 RepID=A0A370HA33_9HYPH|nr:ABC transporter ATP-binding protein [Microvirga subterranea]RDI53806.1 amino acid/amide ABC transporter ATP-binding protein 1 (HAAT family) [Microvirga subterranea]
MTRAAADNIVEVRGLTKRFHGFAAVSNVDLDVRRRSVHALIGPNGAGKTTFFNLITKVHQPSEGSIRFNGDDITNEDPAHVARRGMVRSFQISAIFPRMTVAENVRIALQRPKGISFHFWRSDSSLSVLDDRVDELLAAVGLEQMRDKTAGGLPYGRKRALEFATTLALDPELLLLDEPTSGLGTEDVERIAALIRSVSANRTIIMVEHNLSIVARLADRITVLARGKILAEGTYSEVSTDPRVIEAYIGGDE